MKRLGVLLGGGALILGLAFPAVAQVDLGTGVTVNFNGQMRTIGWTSDNLVDYTDDTGGLFDDGNAFYISRFRLFTTIETVDKKARAIWGLEIGDITWGRGGGSSANAYGGSGARTGPSQGGELGADGVNVETKRLLLQFEGPFIPNTTWTVGIQGVNYLASAAGGNFFGDDAAAIKFNWKGDPVDVEFYTVKLTENNVNDSDDNDMYVLKLGVNATPDVRFTVEAMIIDQRCFQSEAGDCVQSANISFGDNLWIGGTVQAKVAASTISGTLVWGQAQLARTDGTGTLKEDGFGINALGQVPIGPAQTL